jgi:hypothetical protein
MQLYIVKSYYINYITLIKQNTGNIFLQNNLISKFMDNMKIITMSIFLKINGV